PATLKFGCWLTAKPFTMTRSRYFPGGSAANTYSPEPFVLARCSPPGPRNCTRAPGTKAPDGSVITPRRLAMGCVWAHVAARDNTTAAIILDVFIFVALYSIG